MGREHESAKRAKKMGEDVQYAITVALPNTVNGAFWGFTTVKDAHNHFEAFKKAGGRILARKLQNDGCLIEIEPNYLINSVLQIDSEAYSKKDIEVMTQALAKSSVDFKRFLLSKAKKGNFTGKIGIYCTNDVNNINIKGVSYPSFRVSINDVLQSLNQFGYRIKINGQFITPQQAQQAGEALWGSMELSPTKTGLFIEIASTLSKEQIQAVEKQFIAQFGK